MSQEFTCGPNGGDNRDFMPAESWRILRIMSEFVESFDRMGSAKQLHVSVFGSARTPAGSKYYASAEEVGKLLVQSGYGVITGTDIFIEDLDALYVNTGRDGIYSEEGNITLKNVSGAITAGEGYAALKSDNLTAVITVNGNETAGETGSDFSVDRDNTQED
jgi:hypothetical protein